jgi:hypothetical protein
MFWEHAGTYCLNMLISVFFSIFLSFLGFSQPRKKRKAGEYDDSKIWELPSSNFQHE